MMQAQPSMNPQIQQNAMAFAQMANGGGMGGPAQMRGPMPGGAMGNPQQGGGSLFQRMGPQALGLVNRMGPQAIDLFQRMGENMQMPQQQGGGPQPMPGMMPQRPPPQGMQNPGMSFTGPEMQRLAGMGRMGDSVMAHMTPGEIAVPPQVQTPKVLATLNNAFQSSGVNPQQFVAGSPQANINPQTGLQENSFFSALLPMALTAIAPMAAPALAPMLGMGELATGALLSGMGGALGGIIGGKDPLQSLLAGAGTGLGSYALGSMFDAPLAGAADTAGTATPTGASGSAGAKAGAFGSGSQPLSVMGKYGGMSTTPQLMAQTGGQMPAPMPQTPAPSGGSSFFSGRNLGQMAGGALGGMLGNSLYTPPAPSPQTATNERMPPVGQLPSWDNALGQNSYKGPTPNFTGYDPFSPMAPSFNFFPRSPIA